MKKIFTKKRIIALFSALLTLIIIAIFFVTQFVFPITVTGFNYETSALISDIDSYKEKYYDIQNGSAGEAQILRKEDPFPSDNTDDYIKVHFKLDLKSHSLFRQSVTGMFSNVSGDSNMVFKDIDVMPTVISGADNVTYIISVLVYRGNLNDIQLLNLIYKQNIDLYFANITGTHKITIDLIDYVI